MSDRLAERLVQLHAALREAPWPGADDLDADSFAEALWIAYVRGGTTPDAPGARTHSAGGDDQATDGRAVAEQRTHSAGGDDQATDGRAVAEQEQPEAERYLLAASADHRRGSLWRRRERPDDGHSESTVKALAPRTLLHALALGRALRPLQRRVASRVAEELEEQATIVSFADTQLWHPVLRARPERWLDLVLIIDQGASMELWRDTIGEFIQLAQGYGIFRQVLTYGITTDRTAPWLRPYVDLTGGRSDAREPGILGDPSGRRLFLVMSDCVAESWYDPASTLLLQSLAAHGQLALIQLLPERMWSRTALGPRPQALLHASGSPYPGSFLREALGLDDVEQGGLAVPVAALDPSSLEHVARLIAGLPGAAALGTIFAPGPTLANSAAWEPPADIEARVALFEAQASPAARELARRMAVLPVTLPVTRLMAQGCRPAAGLPEIAELFLSGLLVVEAGRGRDPDQVLYQFVEGARVLLARTVTVEERRSRLLEVGREMARLLYLPTTPDTFEALVRMLCEPAEESSFSKDFALLTARTLELLGGATALRQAEQLWRRFPRQPATGPERAAPEPPDTPPAAAGPSQAGWATEPPETVAGPGRAWAVSAKDLELLATLLSEDSALIGRLLAESIPGVADPRPEGSQTSDPAPQAPPPSRRPLASWGEGNQARLAVALAELDTRFAELRARWELVAARVDAHDQSLPALYQDELDQARQALDDAAHGIARIDQQLHAVAARLERLRGSLRALLGLFPSPGDFDRLELSANLIAEVGRHLDRAEAKLETIARLPQVVAAATRRLTQLLEVHAQALSALAGLGVGGQQLVGERDLLLETRRLVEALPSALRDGAANALLALPPQWVADAKRHVDASTRRIEAGVQRLRRWREQVEDADAQFADLERLVAQLGRRKAGLQQLRRGEVLGQSFVELQQRLAELQRDRRTLDVAGGPAFADALDRTVELAETLEAELEQAGEDLDYLRATLRDLGEKLDALRLRLRQGEAGPFPVAWDSTGKRLEELAGRLLAMTAPARVEHTGQTEREVKQADALARDLEALDRRIAKTEEQRDALQQQMRSPLLQRDQRWADDLSALGDQAKKYGRPNWPPQSRPRQLAADARSLLGRIGRLPRADIAIHEQQLRGTVTTVEKLVADIVAIEQRSADIRSRLSSLSQQAATARRRLEPVVAPMARLVAARAANDRLRQLHDEAHTLRNRLWSEPISGAVEGLGREAEILAQRIPEACAAYLAALGGSYSRELQGLGSELARINQYAPLQRERPLHECREGYGRLAQQVIPGDQPINLDQTVDRILHLDRILKELRALAAKVALVAGVVQERWTAVTTTAQQARASLDALSSEAAAWPPVPFSRDSIEQRLRRADQLANTTRTSETLGEYRRRAGRAVAAYKDCLREAASAGRRLERARGALVWNEQQVTRWLYILEKRVAEPDVPAWLRELALMRQSRIDQQLKTLHIEYNAGYPALTPQAVAARLHKLWLDAQEPIGARRGMEDTDQALVTQVASDGTMRVELSSPQVKRRR